MKRSSINNSHHNVTSKRCDLVHFRVESLDNFSNACSKTYDMKGNIELFANGISFFSLLVRLAIAELIGRVPVLHESQILPHSKFSVIITQLVQL